MSELVRGIEACETSSYVSEVTILIVEVLLVVDGIDNPGLILDLYKPCYVPDNIM